MISRRAMSLDVLAGVAVRRGRPALGGRLDRFAEAVDLDAGVVDVMLAGDVGPGRREDPAERVADGRPPGVPEVDRTGRVGRHELEVDLLLGEDVAPPVRVAGLDHHAGERAGGGRAEADVEEARPGHVDTGDIEGAGSFLQMFRDARREIARRNAGLLGDLERDVRRIVAMLGVPGAFHAGRRR